MHPPTLDPDETPVRVIDLRQPDPVAPPILVKPREYHKRAVFVPIEHKVMEGATAFVTSDRRVYVRDTASRVIHRATPKVRGKKARAADKQARRRAR